MKPGHLFAFLLVATLSACAGQTRTTPTLTAPPLNAAQADPPKRGFFEQAGDATWSIVTAPARLIPSKKPAVQETPETYEAPTVTFISRNDSPAPASPPAQSPVPATGPSTP